MTVKEKILEEAMTARIALENYDFKTVHECALRIADLSDINYNCTPGAVEKEASCTPTNVSPVKEANSEEFKIKVSGNVTMSRSGHDKNRGNYSDNRTLAGDVTIEVKEPQDLAKNLAEIWAGVFNNYLNNRNHKE